MDDDREADDVAARAARLYHPDRLPVMNWPLRRAPGPSGPPRWKASPYILKKGMFGEMPPRLTFVNDLIEYEVVVKCAGCGKSGAADLPKFMEKGGRSSFQHLVTVLACEACGSAAEAIHIYRTKDVPTADYPRLIYENPMCRRYRFT